MQADLGLLQKLVNACRMSGRVRLPELVAAPLSVPKAEKSYLRMAAEQDPFCAAVCRLLLERLLEVL
jgi:hypothetical protein